MRIGDLLGERYRLDEFVDGGAMGEVWRATDTRLNRTVAVKVLHASLSGSRAFRRRFESEARSAAALRAPGVVNVYDFGEDDSGDGNSKSFLVMEFVDGRPLSAIIADKGRMSPGDVMALTAKVATALDAAHRAGVIHRDIKPGNILLTEDGTVKVVDFGIARAQGEAGLTSTGQVMGTVAYVSPEQLYDEELTGASDIYSLGVVAYECLSGRKPFNADAPAAVIRAQLHETPPPLPASVPNVVSEVVMKCLAKDASERWESGAALSKHCRQLAAMLPQGDSTEEMSAADLDDDDVTVRVAAPGRSAVSGTRALPSASRDDDSTILIGRGKPGTAATGADTGRNRKKLAAIVAVALLGLLVLTGAVWGMWGGDGDDGRGSADKTSKSESTEKSKSEEESSEDTWENTGDYTGEPSSSGSPSDSESPSSQSPSKTPTKSPSQSPSQSDDNDTSSGDDKDRILELKGS
ncbi:serine/threonine-protein kinase [Stackebrandtia nassauensis]|uniref:non-specific serine/threonine protein kinase n=1 Tax=Stackebrandtia nassauensis (strain DSM 44728 / CIP 108903 / NRRL B-16338 / NBRC 102104 / LLR-40K-21) TaxID=446470 RepID=D3Q3X5_STANL|nr:serine/threonine-protein kinase [Stackebrandtia nassauensis]ADD44042.1 serine/threonine protein kinase [Stackebrandtia nassauensis DSM 44728]